MARIYNQEKVADSTFRSPLSQLAESKLGKFLYSTEITGMEKRGPTRYPNKSIYIGEWNPKTGLREGKGLHIWSDGRYEG